MHSLYQLAVLSLLVLMVTACGFKLRGQANLPPAMAVTYIKTNRPELSQPSALAATLSQALDANGVKVTQDREKATAILDILSEQIQRRTVAATRKDQTRQYILAYNVAYQVTLADGTKLLPRQQIGAYRNLIYQESQVLGTAEADNIALQEMQSDLSSSIIRRLQLVSGN